MNENSFETWWQNNKESEDLHNTYKNCLSDMQEVEPDFKQTFKQWAKEYWKDEI